MTIDDEFFSTIVVAWVIIVTIMLAILLPYTVNVPILPSLFYKALTERSTGSSVPGFVAGPSVTNNADGLLVSYDFEDELFFKNHVFYDRSGNNYNAIAHGVFISQGQGVIGNRSVVLPGTGYLYTDPDPAAGLTNVTFSLWFTVPDQTHNYRLADAISSSDPRTGWILGSKSSELWDAEGDPIRVLTSTRSVGSLPFTAWNHKVVVYNGSHVTEYLNGIVVTRYSASGKPLGAGKAMLIGSWQPFGQNYAGQVDEFRIYGRALDADEVTELYAEGLLTGRTAGT